ncbi:MAG: hypothetical protein AAB653_02140, partial [Patescibacteria group bacterium]
MANQQIQQKKNNKFRAFFSLCLVFFCIIFIFIFNPININNYNYGLKQLEAQAGELKIDTSALSMPAINVKDAGTKGAVGKVNANQTRIATKNSIWEKLKQALIKTGSSVLQTTIGKALNQIAYDYATWIGSGNKGQAPLFITEGWGTYLGNIANNAGGDFIEKVGKGMFGEKFNLCEPSLTVKYKIGLGLVQSERPEFAKPDCSVTEMIKSWGNFSEDLKKKKLLDFLDISATGDRKKRLKNMQDAI